MRCWCNTQRLNKPHYLPSQPYLHRQVHVNFNLPLYLPAFLLLEIQRFNIKILSYNQIVYEKVLEFIFYS